MAGTSGKKTDTKKEVKKTVGAKKTETAVKKEVAEKPIEESKAVQTEKPMPVEEAPARKKMKQIDRSEMIPCRSVTNGQLTYISTRTGLMTIWNDFGTVEYLEYGELLTMRASQPKFLNKPWIIVEDEEVIDTIAGLRDMYNKMALIGNDLDEFFKKSPEEIENIIKDLPNGAKGLLASKARVMVENGTLYDLRVIGIIDKYMRTGLKDFIK
jgi:hypothetical protein